MDLSQISVMQHHPLFKNDKHALQIVAYYDEVETANCLGSHAGHNSKLGKSIKFYSIHAILYVTENTCLFRYVLLHFGQSET